MGIFVFVLYAAAAILGLFFVITNTIVDLVSLALDPRVSLEGAR